MVFAPLLGLLLGIGAADSAGVDAMLLPPPAPPRVLPAARVRDLEATDRLFQRGLPVSEESFSPDGSQFAYLHLVPGGFLRRKPERCAFLLDLLSGDNRAVRAPKGRATRIGGWDDTGRYLLIETEERGWLSPLTGSAGTYHWIFDVVTAEFPKRRSFTGVRDGQMFRWKADGTYHGRWDGDVVVPMFEGELARHYVEFGRRLSDEEKRRHEAAGRLALGLEDSHPTILENSLERLDQTWTQRGSHDPIVSDLFGDRPTLFARPPDRKEWVPVHEETEYVAVLDGSLALITGPGGEQSILCLDRFESVPLPTAPEGWSERLRDRWDRTDEFWDELDPLPRDLQYRRDWDEVQGTATYFNWVKPDRSQVLLLYSFGPLRRVLRVVELPETWRPAPEGTGRIPESDSGAGEVSGI
ncbi:MAG: hypothetical protein R3B81_03195 [bacterium]